MSIRFIIFSFILVLIDLYVFRAIRAHVINLDTWLKYSIYIAFWSLPLIFLSVSFYYLNFAQETNFRSSKLFLFLGAFFVLFTLPKLIILTAQFLEDISKLMAFLLKKLSNPDQLLYENADKISRSEFITHIGLILSVIPFLASIYGILVGRFNFSIIRKKIKFSNLPKAFSGFRIVQFSDLHIGSLKGHEDKLIEAIELMNAQNPDVVFFTGDIVNNIAAELDGWENILSKIKAKYGVFSILGNHDYGEYFPWKNEEDKKNNLNNLIARHQQMGFKLLLNDAAIIEKSGERIAILGVENWGKRPFPQYGNLNKALERAGDVPFKLLLSHDPTHFDEKVAGKTDIALTFSGHTHGMQFAINFGGINWSPVSWKYPKWGGLYQHKDKEQYLYVNIGLGYIGFPGRVGTNPEITVFELQNI
ncbi:MAG: metallophosphoesterase [Bacteroidales bacterium]|nr:metallophosphoesterase [Bacteroidales bacterium]